MPRSRAKILPLFMTFEGRRFNSTNLSRIVYKQDTVLDAAGVEIGIRQSYCCGEFGA